MRRQVRNAVDAGDGDVRVQALRRQLGADPTSLAARLELARHYVQAGFPEIALEHYRFAADRYPDAAEVAIALARTLYSIGLPREGKAHLEAWVATHADAPWDARSWLGILEDRAGEYVAAEANHRAALQLRSASDALHNNLGYNLLLQGRNAEAAAEFRRALELAPKSIVARSNLAISIAGESREAAKEFEAINDPATAHSNLAAVLIERGDYQGARREIDVALGYRKDHKAALSNLQLVAELDGGDVAFSPAIVGSSVGRFVRSLGVALFGEPVTTPGRKSTGPSADNGESAEKSKR
jgi:Flp pilus assembly protein TadD